MCMSCHFESKMTYQNIKFRQAKMLSMCKFLYFVLIISNVTSTNNEWYSSCTANFPACIMDGKTSENTACVNQFCDPKFKGCIELPPDAEFRQVMLDTHNELRNKIASGAETRGGMTSAANMKVLSYDLGLEYTAICQVHGCILEHDECRSTSVFPLAGQNLALVMNEQNLKVKQEHIDKYLTLATLKGMVVDWYEEIKLDNFKDHIDKFLKFSEETGHFTGMMWGNTSHVGCAKAIDRSKEYEFTIYLTCNYAPPGNIMGSPMFIRGAGCSRCAGGTKCNTKYTSLCGEVEPAEMYAGENPFRAEKSLHGHQNALSSLTLPCSLSTLTFVLVLK